MSIISGLKYVFRLGKSDGPTAAFRHMIRRAHYKITVDHAIESRRSLLSSRFAKVFSSTVKHGPFKGMRLISDKWWGNDSVSMYFGLYEQEILNELASLSREQKIFIDIGAANGYYAIGVLVGSLFEESICYELSDNGRDVIQRNAVLNGVSNKIEIRGAAQKDFFEQIPDGKRQQAVLLIDIEGAEFELLTDRFFNAFRRSTIFVELHERAFADGQQRLANLRAIASQMFNIKEIRMGARDPGKFLELQELSDTDRWLICSEGRPFMMHWWRLDPKIA
jgi:hypothetical protein